MSELLSYLDLQLIFLDTNVSCYLGILYKTCLFANITVAHKLAKLDHRDNLKSLQIK